MEIIETDKIYSYIFINDGEWDDFYKAADVIESSLKIRFKTQLNDLDSKYWDFIYRNKEITLHYHTGAGDIEIYTNKENGKDVLIDVINGLSKV